jgi:xylulose-5-phosphate/fructose-6-phosphate phosphoketolase
MEKGLGGVGGGGAKSPNRAHSLDPPQEPMDQKLKARWRSLPSTDHCLRSWNRTNVIVAGKQPQLQWLSIGEAVKHCTAGIGIWEWASSDKGSEPDVVMACAGDAPSLETLAVVDLLRRRLTDLRIRLVNVVDLMTLQPREEHPHGLTDYDFDARKH